MTGLISYCDCDVDSCREKIDWCYRFLLFVHARTQDRTINQRQNSSNDLWDVSCVYLYFMLNITMLLF